MIPVPQALETVLTETAISIWFDRQCNNNEDTKTSTTLSNAQQILGRKAAFDIKAPSPGYPNHNASIMDGYAVKTSDLISAKEAYDGTEQEQKDNYILDFDVIGKVYAGDDNTDIVQHTTTNQRTAIYVTTGAVVPTGYDAVIPIEDTNAIDDCKDNIQIISSKVQSVLSTKPLTWIRPVGCDIPSDYVVLSKGEMIQPVHIALLAQVGISLNQVSIKRLPRVGILSTGNELLSVSDDKQQAQQKQQIGKIPDVNRPMLLSQLSTYDNCSPIDLGIVTDDDGHDNIAQRLTKILWPEETEEGIDVLITTGGISMGEKDIMEQIFVKGMCGKVHFGRMNMKPGKPTTFITIDREDTKTGKLQRKLIFALPGNPVSASVCSELLVRPCLDFLHDGVDIEEDTSKDTFVEHAVNNARVHEEIMATITSDIKLDQGRPEYRRVTLKRVPSSQDGSNGHQQYTYHATHTGVQRSSRILSLRGADGLIMLPRGGTAGCGYDIAKKGLEFPVLLYSSLSTSSSNHTRFMNSMHRDMLKQSNKKFALGLIICTSEEKFTDHFQTIKTTLVKSLGGDDHVSLVHKAVCKVDDTLVEKLPDIINGSQLKDTNVIFVVVPTDSTKEENGSGGSIAFKASLEVSHILRPILTKKASALAQQIRMHAASQDPVAALFENVVGTVRDNSAVLVSCSDRGLSGASSGVKSNLVKLIDILCT